MHSRVGGDFCYTGFMPLLYLISSTFGFMMGILLASSVNVSLSVSMTIAAFAFVLFVLNFFIPRYANTVLLSSLVLIACLIGVIRFQSYETSLPKVFDRHFGNTVTHVGRVCSDKEQTTTGETFVLCEEIFGEKILVRTSDTRDARYGDTVTVTGLATKPKNFYTEYGREFDYVSYLRVDGVRYILQNTEVETVNKEKNFSFMRVLFALKNKFADAIRTVVGAPESDLVNGVLLGMRSSFPQEVRSAMVATGTIHIVALSGYNVSIVSRLLMETVGLFVSRTWATFFGSLGILLFVLMTGASASAVRAGMMAALLLSARALGRPADTLRVICYTLIAMLAYNPLLLLYSVSFHLSFLALLGILYLLPLVSRYLQWIKWEWLRELVASTLAAQIAVSPYVFHVMGIFSALSLPINVLILPCIPLLMLLGCFTTLGYFLLPLLGKFFAIPTYWLAHILLEIIARGAQYEGAVVAVSWFPLWLAVLFYVPIAIMMWREYERQKEYPH